MPDRIVRIWTLGNRASGMAADRACHPEGINHVGGLYRAPAVGYLDGRIRGD